MKRIWTVGRASSHWCNIKSGHRLLSSAVLPDVKHIYAANLRFMKTTAPFHLPAGSTPAPVRWFGQPAAQTHPHLMNHGEVTPNITKEEYKHRRNMLVTMAKSMCKGLNAVDDHIFIFPSACRVYMSNDIPYPFRQNSDFLYLSGFQEPNSVLVIHSAQCDKSAVDNHQSTLFVPKKDPHKELWEGPCSGKEGASELTGVDCAYNYNELEQYLSDFCKKHDKFLLWYDFVTPTQDSFHRNVMSQMIGQERHRAVQNTRQLMHKLRVKKSPAEVAHNI